jgi:hypothetical protein
MYQLSGSLDSRPALLGGQIVPLEELTLAAGKMPLHVVFDQLLLYGPDLIEQSSIRQISIFETRLIFFRQLVKKIPDYCLIIICSLFHDLAPDLSPYSGKKQG